MSHGDEKITGAVRGILAENKVEYVESDIQHATKFGCKSGSTKCSILVYSSGKMVVQGGASKLHDWLEAVKTSIEEGAAAPGALLPAEIEKLPQTLRERVEGCDDVVVWFFSESLRCYKSGSVAGAAFMLGAASEKAINLLIEKYVDCIEDERNRERLRSRIGNRMISHKYEEFKKSYASCKSKPAEGILAQDLDVLLDGAFNFYRHTRNAVGHPQIIPDLADGVVLANLAQFIIYSERIYGLMNHFEENRVVI